METFIEVALVLWFGVCLLVGANYASNHERVFERISTAFNRIFAFIIGFSFAAWAGLFALTLLSSLYVSVKVESAEPLGYFFRDTLPVLVLILIIGILSIGAISNFIDMRKSLALISQDTAHLREMAAKQPKANVPAPLPASPKLERALQSTAPLGDTPEMTDEEKLAMAKQVAEEAIRKSQEAMKAKASEDDASLDDESPTNP